MDSESSRSNQLFFFFPLVFEFMLSWWFLQIDPWVGLQKQNIEQNVSISVFIELPVC